MNFKLLFAAFALAVLGAGWFAGAGTTADLKSRSGAASSQVAAVAHQPELDVWAADPRLGTKGPTEAAFNIPESEPELGKMTLYVPAGYGFGLTARPGTVQGHVFLETEDDFALGDLKAVDPAAYVNQPQAQACAPGPHAAVWTMKFEFFLSEDTVIVPIFIDPTSGDEAALGAYKLQACLPLADIQSPGGAPFGSKVRHLGLEFTRLANPTAAANYVWRAFVSNPDVSGNPDPATAYELRADMPLPSKLTLTGKYDSAHRRAVLTGRLTTKVSAVSKIPVTLYRRVRGGLWKAVASLRTSANGSYRFAVSNRKTSVYSTEIWSIGNCSGDSTAPGGCVSETRGAIDSPNVRVAVRRHR
jgi:hypothetical protein